MKLKNVKKLFALALAGAMCVSMLTACGGGDDKGGSQEPDTKQEETQKEDGKEEETKNPAEAIADTYYLYAYDVGDMKMTNYFHFYEERPVIGKVFCASFAMNQIYAVGTYDIEEAEYAYKCYKDRAAVESEAEGGEANKTEGTAPYTVTFYDFNGNEIGKCGYDGDVLYNNGDEKLTAVSAGANMYYKEAVDGDYAETFEGELGQTYLSYVSDADATCTVKLGHNGRYEDLVDMMVEGEWTMAETADGYEFTLTPDMDGDTAAVLAVSKDQMTATYTPDGGEAVAMTCTSKEAQAAATFVGEGPEVMEGTKCTVTLYLYDDNTAKVTLGIPGTEMEVEAGTWEAAGSDYTVTLESGTITTAGGSVEYANPSTMIGEVTATLAAQ
ncbi:MAG: hypothetical protein HFH23_02680 [Ruminococcus sp.]|nr:hypothetical protein [Ruminococcus sp.]